MNKKLLVISVIFTISLTLNDGFAAEPKNIPDAAEQKNDAVTTETRTNPFLTGDEEDSMKSKEGRVVMDYLSLSAIFYSPPNSCAIIAGRIVKEGDIIDNKEITKINAEDIILKDTQSEYIIQLKEVLNSKS